MKDSILTHLPKVKMLQAVVETGSFRLASSQAKVTQSAISQAVSQLERAVGKVLLVRERGHVSPTQECLELLEKTRPILASIDSLDVDIQRAVPKMSWLTFGVDESLALTVTPPLLKRLYAKTPQTKLTMRTGSAQKLCSMVRKGELCMAVIRECDALEGLTVMPITEDRLGVFATPEFKKNNKELVKCGFASVAAPEGGHPLYYTKFLKRHLVNIPTRFVCDNYETLRSLALANCFAALLPERLARHTKNTLVPLLGEGGVSETHSIVLISRNDCDYEENQFLCTEMRTFL